MTTRSPISNSQPTTTLAAPCLILMLALAACGGRPVPTPPHDPYPPAATATPAEPYPLGTPVSPSPPPSVSQTAESPATTLLPAATTRLTATIPSTPSSNATATPSPHPPALTSPLVVDGDAGRIYASLAEGASSSLLVYDSADGRLIERKPLQSGEVLLDVDRGRKRLYLYNPDRGIRMLNADDLAPTGHWPLPTPDPGDTFERHLIYGPIPALKPFLNPATGEILTVHAMTLTTHDPDTGRHVRDLRLPLGNVRGPVFQASVSESGRVLYLAVSDEELASDAGDPGTILLALDLKAGTIVDRHDVRALAYGWFAWGENAVAATEVYKDIGRRLHFWQAGTQGLELFDAGLGWTAHDRKRNRLIGPVVADAASLELQFLDQHWSGAALTAYDPVSDQLYAYQPDRPERLEVVAASSIAPEVPAAETPLATMRLTSADAVAPPPGSGGGPALLIGGIEATPGPGTPTPEWSPNEHMPVMSRDSGQSWIVARPSGFGGWPVARMNCLVASPDFARDQTIFGCLRGQGVFRSQDAGRSWLAASAGLTSLSVIEAVVSPDFARDRTLFATTFPGLQSTADHTAWRSRDAGAHWESAGSFTAVAFSPDFARDRTVLAFGFLDPILHISTDGGDHWRPSGRLPRLEHERFVGTRLWVVPANEERPRVLLALGNSYSDYGGNPHWPESGGRVFRSDNDGLSWDLAWEADDDPRRHVALGGALIGPIAGDVSGPKRWVLRLQVEASPHWYPSYDTDVTLVSDDREADFWTQHHLPGDPKAFPIAALPDGKVLFAGGTNGGLREVEVDALKLGPPPPAAGR